MVELHAKARAEADLHRQREEVLSKHQISSEKIDYQQAVQRETEDLQQLIAEAMKEKKEIEREIVLTGQTLQKRADEMAEQMKELDHLSSERADLRRENDKLRH